MEEVYLIGHRGAAGIAPENTFTSFDTALKNGVNAIELDLHQTKDGKIVVIHDTTVDRTTDGKGLVSDFLYEELKKLDAGNWFDSKFSNEKIPLLNDVFSTYKDKVDFMLDIKAGSELYPGIENNICDLIQTYNLLNKTIICSTKITVLNKFKDINCDLKLGKIIKPNELWRTLFDPSSFIHKTGLLPKMVCITPHWTMVNPNLIFTAKENGLSIFPWTVDKERLMRSLVFRGVDGIITNFPDMARRVIDS